LSKFNEIFVDIQSRGAGEISIAMIIFAVGATTEEYLFIFLVKKFVIQLTIKFIPFIRDL
jgi:hypothetical protein